MKELARWVLAGTSFAAFAGCMLVHVAVVTGRQGLSHVVMLLLPGVVVLGALALLMCMFLANVQGILGRANQWRYITERCPRWWPTAWYVLAANAGIWWILVVMRMATSGVSSHPKTVLGTLSAFFMVFYFAYGMIFWGFMCAPAAGRDV